MTDYNTFSKRDKLYPITSSIVGVSFAQLLTDITLLPILGLAIYIYTNIWLKNYWIAKNKPPLYSNEKIVLSILLIIGIISYFSLSYSLLALPILLILSFFIQTKFMFMHFKLNHMYTFLYTYVLIIILNLLSYYFQLRYLSLSISLNIFSTITVLFFLLKIVQKHLNNNSK